jgi:hypothetical protein
MVMLAERRRLRGAWPELPFEAWQDTQWTLHRWAQIVGKTRLTLTPPVNHWWHSTLQVHGRGLTTGLVPYGSGGFEVELDLTEHWLRIHTTEGQERNRKLGGGTVAEFYRDYLRLLASLGVEVTLRGVPDEVPDPVPFADDTAPALYDPAWANRFWRVLLAVQPTFQRFRAGFLGKCSPVHFFWGSFDLAVTRFSGRCAPPKPEADWMQREAYSHECSSCGFWPGNGGYGQAAFYAYHAPPPPGFAEARVEPAAARWETVLGGEFVLPYEAVRVSDDPEATLERFLQSTYVAGAEAAGWDRAALERAPTRTGSVSRCA